MRFDTRRNAVGVILIEQKDPAAAIFETAGRANSNKLGTQVCRLQGLLALVVLDLSGQRSTKHVEALKAKC
jgi:hypothetical protein